VGEEGTTNSFTLCSSSSRRRQGQNWGKPDYRAAKHKEDHHDSQYEDAGCEILEDLSECGLIIGIKQPEVTFLISYIL
jgi:hypothetical protein